VKDIVLVVPTIRGNCIRDFIARWNGIGLFEHVDLLVMEDNPNRTFDIQRPGSGDLFHLSWEDIAQDLGDRQWIIPRRSDCVRSYGYFKAFNLGHKYILTLDDDCYPCVEKDGLVYDGHGFLDAHIQNLEKRPSRWFNTLNSVKPRGIPFFNTGTGSQVIVSHGLWTNVLDYDAPYQLANPVPEKFSYDVRTVPRGQYFPMCGMNVMWRREATVLMYHMLMGQQLVGGRHLDKLPFDRFGDIWAGIVMKRVADHFGYAVATGLPYIHHERASDPFVNLRKEAAGIQVNEQFWNVVDGVDLSESYATHSCYFQIGKAVAEFDDFPEHVPYFKDLGHAMQTWAELFV